MIKRKGILQTNNFILFTTIICIVILLILRDIYSIEINKIFFVFLFLIGAIFLRGESYYNFLFFLIPLFNGLPGNYFILIYLVRYVFEHGASKLKIKPSFFLVFSILSILSLLQCFMYDYDYLQVLYSIIGMLFFILLVIDDSATMKSFVYYIFGVSVMCLILLFATLQTNQFGDLFQIGYRLGDDSLRYAAEGKMSIFMDPNYIGLFSISSLSLFLALKTNKMFYCNKTEIFALICSIVAATIAFMGLSRSFVIVVVLLFICYLFVQRKIKSFLGLIFGILTSFFLFVNLFPTAYSALIQRFAAEDVRNGGGRLQIITQTYSEWINDEKTFLFGTGLFDSKVHCMPLQYLFGGGFLYFVFLCALLFLLLSVKEKKKNVIDIMPLLMTFAMSCTIPLAASNIFMAPIIISMVFYVFRKKGREQWKKCVN